MRRRKGQSILEYVIVLTAIVAAIAYVAANLIPQAISSDEGSLGASMRDTIEDSSSLLPD